MIHLTNNAVQQLNKEDYGKHEEGNQLSFKQASEIMQAQGINIDFFDIYQNQIEPIIEMTMKCVESTKLNPNQRRNTFEIMGYDFMIDENLQPWLIEVNTNPCIEETSKLLKMLLARMIDDAFRLTIDLAFPAPPPKENEPKPLKQMFPVDGYPD